MKSRLILLALLVAFETVIIPLRARANTTHAEVSLLSETDQPRPGSTFLIGIRILPAPGWHSYWSNPGDSGIPPHVQWKAPPGLRFGPLLHPAPTLLKVGGAVSYVHAGEHILLARAKLVSTLKRGSELPIQARLVWATCSTSLCVPQRATLSLSLKAGIGSPNSSAISLKLAEQRLPTRVIPGVLNTRAGAVRMMVPGAAHVDPARATFFPDSNEMIAASTLHLRVFHGRTEILGQTSGSQIRSSISGVLSDGKKSYALSFRNLR